MVPSAPPVRSFPTKLALPSSMLIDTELRGAKYAARLVRGMHACLATFLPGPACTLPKPLLRDMHHLQPY